MSYVVHIIGFMLVKREEKNKLTENINIDWHDGNCDTKY